MSRFDEILAELSALVEKRLVELNAHVAVFLEIRQKLAALGRAHKAALDADGAA